MHQNNFMPNTYTQLHVQYVFAVKYREAVLNTKWDEDLRKYITGIFQTNGHKMLAINNVDDHIHIFGGLNPKQSISELMRLTKCDSSEWINKKRLTKHKFHWQEGYSAFSYNRGDLDRIYKYVMNQQEHHKTISLPDEQKALLTEFEVEYNERYLFQPLI